MPLVAHDGGDHHGGATDDGPHYLRCSVDAQVSLQKGHHRLSEHIGLKAEPAEQRKGHHDTEYLRALDAQGKREFIAEARWVWAPTIPMKIAKTVRIAEPTRIAMMLWPKLRPLARMPPV